MNFPVTLKALREEKGVYQKEPAAYLNVSIGTISNYEQGIHAPDLDTVCKLASHFNVSTDYLLCRTKYKYDLSILRKSMIKGYTVTDLLYLLQKLSRKELENLVDYLKLLEFRLQYDPDRKK